jgi:cardiolipin synthase
VEVYLLVDGYEARQLPRAFINELRAAGIRFKLFNPLFKSRYFYFGRRLHQKVVVVDATYALVGGINIADRYNDMPGEPAWLDFALYMEGEIARELCVLCWKGWNNYAAGTAYGTCEPVIGETAMSDWPVCNVSMRRNDWVRRKNEISATYIEMLRHAQKEVIFLCSYFLPGRIIRKQLGYAMQRGIRVRVITAGRSDIPVSKNAEKYMYDWILRNDIALYEYNKGVLHGKIAVCDGQWLTIGSYNINNISAYASIELNMNVQNAGLAASAEKMLNDTIDNDCTRITRENHARAKNLLNQFFRWLSYYSIRVMIYLSTFYYRRRE